jgi:hypothetical protein
MELKKLSANKLKQINSKYTLTFMLPQANLETLCMEII